MVLVSLKIYVFHKLSKVVKSYKWKTVQLIYASYLVLNISEKYPAEISGGEKQRTAVARALMNNPDLILADEPTGNLDSKSCRTVIESFLKAKQELDATILMVTHDSFAASFCDRVIVLKDGIIYKEVVKSNSRHKF